MSRPRGGERPALAHALFEARAQASPDACALITESPDGPDRRISYGELNLRANQFARRLIGLGVGRGAAVGVCLPRTEALVVAMLGVLKAGGAVVPLDPQHPPARLKLLLGDARAAVLVTDRPGMAPELPCVQPSECEPDGTLEQQGGSSPDDTAFVIYTSGSTGRPKGVRTLHRNWVHSTRARLQYYREPLIGCLGVSSFSFDTAIGALLWTLSAGGTFFLAAEQTARDPRRLVRVIARGKPTHCLWLPSLYELMLQQGKASDLESLRVVIVGGEACPPRLFDAHAAVLPSASLYNEYGPTEATVWSTVHRCKAGETPVPIGQPIPGTRIALLNDELCAVDDGEIGEICIGGHGVAAGYLNQPALTAERFVDIPGLGRMYRSGDRGRRLPDGSLAFLGRVDNQVKVRGFRIELDEIESVLGRHRGVQQVCASVRSDRGADPRLVAYFSPSEGAAQQAQAELVEQWHRIDDATYGQPVEPEDPTFDIVGWNDSYQGQPIPAEQMREWIEHTVERIAALLPVDARVLELGCGAGLLLYRLAPACASYLGTDISQRALDTIAARLSKMPEIRDKVSLRRCAAHQLSGVAPGSVDVVVLNSVLQFFPSHHYLRDVLEIAVQAVAPGGAVFVGDVRPLSLLRAFRAEIELVRSGADVPITDLTARVDRATDSEEELVVDPALFRAFAAGHRRVSRVEVQLKRGHTRNEMTTFRYDVVLWVGDRPAAEPQVPALEWGHEVQDVESVFRHMSREDAGSLLVRDVPNGRLRAHRLLLQALDARRADITIGNLRRAIDEDRQWGVDPERWWRRGAALRLDVQIAPAREACAYDVLLTRQDVVRPSGFRHLRDTWDALANQPWWDTMTRKLAAELRECVAEQLPAYMVPAAFVPVRAFPQTVTGKIDRAALPEPPGIVRGSGAVLRSELENRIAAVWRDVLRAHALGADDNFFDLGGNSLLLLQVQARLQQMLDREIEVVTLFQHPTIASLARALAGSASVETGGPVRTAGKAAAASADAVAIVGMAGRFPGAASVEAFWQNLRHGVDCVTRVQGAQAGPRVKAGGLLDEVDAFDAAFFGYSPAEAARLDPQQRLFLECAYHALEDAGCDPLRFGGAIGVYAGSDFNTYFINNVYPGQGYEGGRTFLETAADMHITLANAPDFLATRVSYKLGLRGPGINVHTGCSTSLVAVHLACEALLSGSCDLALAGGVSLRVPQGEGYLHEEGGILSPDGICRAFDVLANGTVFGSGLGVVALRRLSDALADGDKIHAVIRGSALNNDGSAKAGFTAPGVDGQADVIARALERAGIAAADVGYVEAHGSGTPIGDSIELTALTRVFASGAGANGACALGSVKGNIGHLAHAAGVAGLIKAALAVEHGEIPPHLHCDRPHPLVEASASPFYINTTPQAWGNGTVPRRAGVSSFGMGGTNAHVILEQAPAPPARSNGPQRGAHLLTLSAKTPEVLARLVQRTAECLAQASQEAVADICTTANTGRRALEHRVAVAGATPAELRLGLLDATPTRSPSRPPRVAFLFPGQGAQYARMGADLYETQPVFREHMDRCDHALRPQLGLSIVELLYGPAQDVRLFETDIGQPLLFSVQVALAAVWRDWGVEPDAVAGHSLGEYAAAVTAGVLAFEDALRIVAERGRLMARSPEGAMASLALGPDEARQAISGFDVTIAAINGPERVVIAGTVAAVDAACASLPGERVHRLPMRHAFHSALMDPVLAPFEQVLQGTALSAPAVPFVSTVSGAVAGPEITDIGYWRNQIRQPVRLYPALRTLHDLGIDIFIEAGPATTLLSQGRMCLPEEQAGWLASLRQGRDSWRVMLESVGELYTRGAMVDLAAIERGFSRRRVRLPTYPFQRQRCWITPPRSPVSSEMLLAHPLLGRRLSLPGSSEIRFEAQFVLDSERHRYLDDHRVEGHPVFPLSAYVEMALAAAREISGARPLVLRDLAVERPLVPAGPGKLQTVLTPDGPDAWSVQIFHRSNDHGDWSRHALGRIAPGEGGATPSLDACRQRCPQPAPVDSLYARLGQRGIEYGRCFRGVEALWVGTGVALSRVRMPTEGLRDASVGLHPALLDACFHALECVMPEGGFLPMVLDQFERLPGRGDGHLWSFVERQAGAGDDTVVCVVSIFDEQGAPVAACRGLTLRRLRPPRDAADSLEQHLYETRWMPRPHVTAPHPAPSGWVLCGNPAGLSDRLAAHLSAAGEHAMVLEREQDVQQWMERGGPAVAVRHVVHLCGLTCGSGEDAEAQPQPLTGLSRGWGTALALVQEMLARELHPRLWIVTRGAQPVGGPAALAIQQAPLWGLGKAIALEHPELSCTTVDLDPFADDAKAAAELAAELLAQDAEREVAYRNGRRLTARLQRIESDPGLATTAGQPVQVCATGRSLQDIVLRPLKRRSPQPGEVEIAVRAAGLNLRDVLTAVGSLVADGADGPFGYECAGVVVGVGPNVSGFEPGDEVIALARGSLASFVTTRAEFVARKPARLTFEQGATLPAAFLTAHYGLHTLAGLAAGERVLVHAAAGGVGQAAVQIAHRAGAQVIATASRGKWAALHAAGVSKVLNSRTLDFADQVMRETHGQGVDVVLNSLNRDFAPRSLAALGRGGRFVELGKIGVLADDEILSLRPDARPFSFDLGQISAHAPQVIARLFRELTPLFEQGALLPLPHRVFRLADAPRAFRFMAEAQHVGKIVLSVPDDSGSAIRLRRDAAYMITGGLGGLGMEVARWLAAHGATDLVLVSRRPHDAPAAVEAQAQLQRSGARVRIVQADVSRWEEVEHLVAACADRFPLRGIFHCAGVLEDGLLPRQTAAAFERVLAPKAQGAWNLHALTRGLPLDFFVLFSSAASVTGSVGQAGYVAANAFLDSLAHHRRALGLPALSINWGAWDEAGMAARLGPAHQARLSALGVQRFGADAGLGLLARLMVRDAVQVAVLPLDWARWLAGVPHDIPLFERVRPRSVPERTPVTSQQSEPADLDRTQTTALVRRLAAATLGFDDPDMVPGETSLLDLGLDSLMVLDLKSRLQRGFGRRLPTTVLFDHPSVDDIVDFLLGSSGHDASGFRHSTLVPIRSQGIGAPLFFLPGVGGSAVDLMPLGAAFYAQRPLLGLRSLGFEEGEQPLLSIEEIAAHHVQSIRASRIPGPWLLGGHSFGGVVAYEMARQFEAGGTPVPLLFIVDIQARGSPMERDADRWSEARAANVMLQMIHHSRPGAPPPPAMGQDLSLALAWLERVGHSCDAAEFRRALEVFRANMTAMTRYRPSARLDAQIVLVRSATQRAEFEFLPTPDECCRDPGWGWGALSTRQTEVQIVPGDHFTVMCEPFVNRLADVLAERLSHGPASEVVRGEHK